MALIWDSDELFEESYDADKFEMNLAPKNALKNQWKISASSLRANPKNPFGLA